MKKGKINFTKLITESIFKSMLAILLLIFIINDKNTLKMLIELFNKIISGDIGKLNIILILIPMIILIELFINIGYHVVYNRDIKKED